MDRPEGIEQSRIWIDGCFDFAHHGHAGVMLRARSLGRELYVGVHSDEDILHHKGPVVMRLAERIAAVDACKWSTKAVGNAPYVTLPLVKTEYGCDYVVHGDDITTDADGNDCYQAVKDAKMFVVVERTQNISTTDLVGRMLLMTKTHHFPSATPANWSSLALYLPQSMDRIRAFSTDSTGHKANQGVYLYFEEEKRIQQIVAPCAEKQGLYASKSVYVDGGFDLFHPGHIGVLKAIKERATAEGAAVVVGVHDDATINKHKGLNYPIMNLFERAMCVLQCRYVDAVILAAPFTPSTQFLESWAGPIVAVYHGPTPVSGGDVYQDARAQGLFREVGPHDFDEIGTETIVNRVLENKAAFEERQRRKGWKSENELRLQRQEEAKRALERSL